MESRGKTCRKRPENSDIDENLSAPSPLKWSKNRSTDDKPDLKPLEPTIDTVERSQSFSLAQNRQNEQESSDSDATAGSENSTDDVMLTSSQKKKNRHRRERYRRNRELKKELSQIQKPELQSPEPTIDAVERSQSFSLAQNRQNEIETSDSDATAGSENSTDNVMLTSSQKKKNRRERYRRNRKLKKELSQRHNPELQCLEPTIDAVERSQSFSLMQNRVDEQNISDVDSKSGNTLTDDSSLTLSEKKKRRQRRCRGKKDEPALHCRSSDDHEQASTSATDADQFHRPSTSKKSTKLSSTAQQSTRRCKKTSTSDTNSTDCLVDNESSCDSTFGVTKKFQRKATLSKSETPSKRKSRRTRSESPTKVLYSQKMGLKSVVNFEKMGKRESRDMIKIVRTDVSDGSFININASILVNHFYKAMWELSSDAKDFLSKCPSPRIDQFFRMFKKSYFEREKDGISITDGLGGVIIAEYMSEFNKYDLEKPDGVYRTKLIEAMATKYATNLKNNIRMHVKKHYTAFMLYKFRDQIKSRKDRYRIIRHCKAAWYGEGTYADQPTYGCLIANLHNFKQGEDKDDWWDCIPHLIDAQNQVSEYKYGKLYAIFPQPGHKLHHVEYNQGSFDELWRRVTNLWRKKEGKGKKELRKDAELAVLMKIKKRSLTSDQKRRISELTEQITDIHQKRSTWNNNNPDVALPSHMQVKWRNYERKKHPKDNESVSWSTILDMKNKVFKHPVRKFTNYFSTDGTAVSLLMERPKRADENSVPETITPEKINELIGNGDVAAIDPGSVSPAGKFYKSGELELYQLMARNQGAYLTQEYRSRKTMERWCRSGITAQKDAREALCHAKGFEITARNLHHPEYTAHRLKFFEIRQAPFKDHRGALARLNFGRYIRKKKEPHQTINIFMLNHDSSKFKVKDMSIKAQKDRCKANSAKHESRDMKKRKDIKASKKTARQTARENLFQKKLSEGEKPTKQEIKNSKQAAMREFYIKKTKVRAEEMRTHRAKKKEEKKKNKERRPIIFLYGDGAVRALKKLSFRGRRYGHEKMIAALRSKPNVNLLIVDEFRTTQACSVCLENGSIFKRLTINPRTRMTSCTVCSNNMNRDCNAAKNIYLSHTLRVGVLRAAPNDE